MNESMKRRLFGLGAVAIAAGVLAFFAYGSLGEELVYYWSPTELLANVDKAEGATVRLGGQVVPGTLDWDREAKRATFAVTDGSQQVPVACEGNPPQMFREGIGVVVEGELASDGVFHTDRVMVKHGNEYRTPEDAEGLDKAYETLVTDEGS